MTDRQESRTSPTKQEAARAEAYAQHVAPTFVKVARRAIDLAVIEPGNTVLDVGTATGLAAFLAAERAGREGSVIGLDSSEAMLAVARERSASVGYDFIHWRQSDPAPLSFADESFDSVLCLQTLQVISNPLAVLEEMRRVLVEGGRLVLTLFSGKAGNEWIGLLEEALRRSAAGVPLPAPPALSQPGNLEALLQSAGFDEIEVARAPDRMRFRGPEALWDWAMATSAWSAVLGALPEEVQARTRGVLVELLTLRMRDGEVAIGREILYARAIAPEEP